MIIDNYKKLKKVGIINTPPKTYFPNPTNDDYVRGFIVRYFTQRRDTKGSPIFELKNDVYGNYSNTPYWKGIQLNWKISGNLDDRYNDEGGYIPSVQSVNRLGIMEASKIMPDIELYLVNLSQFYK
jgi:hypothetical protein